MAKARSEPRNVDSVVRPGAGQADNPRTAPKAWREALDRSAGQLAAGRTIDAADVLRHVDESLARLEDKDAARRR
jgi:hypothetical protein